jgi:GTP-binding protein
VDDLQTLRRELELFRSELAAKPQIVAANKVDAVDDEERVQALARRAEELGLPFFRVSAATGEGVQPLLEAIWRQLALEREASVLTSRESGSEG